MNPMTAATTNPASPASSSKLVTPPRYRNGAEFLHDLGDIALERIIFDPWPGTATEADLLQKVEVEKHLCELVEGTLVEKPMGLYESVIAMLLGRELLNFILPRRLGLISGENGPLRLKLGLVRLPDISFILSARVKAAGGIREQIPSLIPDLAVEVLSPSNTRREMKRKREEYFSAGVRLVWIIDPAARSAEVYTGEDDMTPLAPAGTLTGGDVLPGFELRLNDLFAQADEVSNSGASPK
jgi:Uma2 family endonuclease